MSEPAETPAPQPDAAPRPRRRLSTQKKIAFAVGSVLGLILALEGGLRLAGYPKGVVRSFSRLWNPDQAGAIGLFRPGKHRIGYPVELAYDVSINPQGLRGGPLAEAKTPGRPRILALGDSVTFGYYVGDAETWPAYLQAKLGDRAEVINAGCGHFSITDEVRYYRERLAQLKPDLVVLQFCTNDVGERELLRSPTLFESIASGKAAKSNLLRQTALGEFQLLMAIRAKEAARRRSGDWPPKSFPGSTKGEPVPEERWSRYAQSLTELKAELDAAKIPLVMTAFANLIDVESTDPPAHETRLTALAAKLGIPFRGVWKRYRTVSDPKTLYLYPLDPHPSALGNRHLADVVADLLTEQKLLGASRKQGD